MLGRIARFVSANARTVLVLAVLLTVAAGAFGATAFGKLQSEGFTDPDAESSRAQELLDSRFGTQSDLTFLVTATSGTVDEGPAAQAGAELTDRLRTDGDVTDVTSYFQTTAAPMRSADGRHALIVATLGEAGDVEDLRARYTGDTGPVRVTLGGEATISVDISGQVASDLLLAESIAVPLILVLLVVVFGSMVAAVLPLIVGAIVVAGTFAALSVLGSLTDVSVFSINLTTALGLGLAIDYALLLVYRFREELARHGDTQRAVVRTVETAGRTIVFSAATVAVALATLLVFPLYFLRSFAYAGVGVVVIAMLASVVVLPALLTVLGPRVNAGRLPWAGRDPNAESPFWGRVAGRAMRRPVLIGAPVIAVLVLAAVPLLRVEFGLPDDRVLPTSTQTRVLGDTLRAQFPANETTATHLVSTADLTPAELTDYASRVSDLPDVTSVDSSAGTFVDGRPRGTGPADAALAGDRVQRLTVLTTADPHSAAAQDLVRSVRAEPTPGGAEVLVGGEAAVLVDSKAAIGDRLPVAAGLIVISTFLLLFLFTGSVLQPLRALLLNVLSLSATLGVLVLIFQDGWLSDWLGFTPMPLNTSMLVLLFCIVFGLSMDYEVFVLSRIKETHDQGAEPVRAVTHGLSRTGRLITMAAMLLAVSLLAFGTSRVSFLQMFGIGSGLAILIDATLIRGILLPVGVRLLGRAAWWAPRPLRRVHRRLGLTEAETEPAKDPAPSSELTIPVR